jgi:ATP-dependent Clp protease ATP-binding subunit ClpA
MVEQQSGLSDEDGWDTARVAEGFTDQARDAMIQAQVEAREMGHTLVGPEHELLGLFADRNGIAGQVLASSGLTIEPVRELVRDRPHDGTVAVAERMPFSPEAKQILELALRIALTSGRIATEHLLIALTRRGQGPAAEVLQAAGVDPGFVRCNAKKQIDNSRGWHDDGRPRLVRVGSWAVSDVTRAGVQLVGSEWVPDTVLERLLTSSVGIALSQRGTSFELGDLLLAHAFEDEV